MGIFSRRSKKESLAGSAIAQFNVGQPVSTPRRYDTLTDEGYIRNVIAYRCVSMISSAVASVCWDLYRKNEEVQSHPVLDLIKKPNPVTGEAEFFEMLTTYLLCAGNAYIERTRFNEQGPPRELYNLRPDRVRVIPNKSGLPQAYEHEVNGIKTTFQVNPVTGISDICHLRKAHPLNDWYGLSPVEAAAYAIDQHNAASLHNTALLQNSANPSGALIFKGTSSQDVIDAAEKRMNDKYANPQRAGRPMVMAGDFEWKQFGLSPKDLDYNEGKLQAAREICTAFGVPHLLIVPGQSTYNNLAEAKLNLWEDTVIPIVNMLTGAFFPWLLQGFGDSSLKIEADLNEVSALSPRREQHSAKVHRDWVDNLITRDEARLALGYDAAGKKGGDEYYTNPLMGAPTV